MQLRPRSSELHNRTSLHTVTSPVVITVVLLAAQLFFASPKAFSAKEPSTTQNFANLAEHFGVPKGVGPLDREVATRRASYELQTSNGKVLVVRRVNGHGNPVENDPSAPLKASIREFKYTGDGSLSEIVLKNNRGLTLGTLRFGPFERRKDGTAEVTSRFVLSISGLIEDGIWAFRTVYDDKGKIQRRLTLDRNLNPAKDQKGTYGRQFVCDESGLPVEESYLAMDGDNKPVSLKGAQKQTYVRDEQGNVTKKACWDADGKPAFMDDSATFQTASEFDALGREVRRAFLDSSGDLADSPNLGYAIKTFAYDEHGNLLEERYLDSQLKSVVNSHGVAVDKYVRDERGNDVETAHYGADGEPVFCECGYHMATRKCDDQGGVIELQYLDTSKKPVLTKEGYSRQTWKLDEWGSVLETAFFGADDKPVAHPRLKFARSSRTLDGRGNVTDQTFFGVDGNQIGTPFCGNATRVKLTYDERANMVESAFFGADGKPFQREDLKYSTMRCQYDERDNRTEEAFFGADGKPVINEAFGYATVRVKYDGRGKTAEEAFFGTDGKPMVNKEKGYASMKASHDASGNTTEEAFFGADGEPMVNENEGYASTKETYDKRGNLTERAYFGADGKPIVVEARGCARIKTKYDERDNETEIVFLGVDGMPMVNTIIGYAGKARKYDADGTVIQEALLGADGSPMDGPDGWARREAVYNPRTREKSFVHFKADGSIVERAGPRAAVRNFSALSER